MTTAVRATVVPQEQRLDFLPRIFGARSLLHVETGVYCWMQRLCPMYGGGSWDYIDLSTGGGYMRPATDESFILRIEGNGFEEAVGADAAGLIVTTMALNSLIWRGHVYLGERFHQLMAYAAEHPESAAILRALD